MTTPQVARFPSRQQSEARNPLGFSSPPVFIIEAPGKIAVFDHLLGELGIDGEVFATRGHVMSFPEGLTPLGIDEQYREILRAPSNRHLVESMKSLCAHRHVVIMTDADQEGDVIASDVAFLIGESAKSITRATLTKLTIGDMRKALAGRAPLDHRLCVPGRARAVADRLIGGTLSHDGIAAGRVLTGLLGEVNRQENEITMEIGEVTLVCPGHKGEFFTAAVPVTSPAQAQRLIDASLRLTVRNASSIEDVLPPARGLTMGGLLFRASGELGIPMAKTENMLQKAYERGLMSYPRTNGQSLSSESLLSLLDRASKSGVNTLLLRHAGDYVKDGGGSTGEASPHEGLHPIGDVLGRFPYVDLSAQDLRAIAQPNALMSICAREIIASSLPKTVATIDIPGHGPVEFSRRARFLPWESGRRPEPRFIPYNDEQILLNIMVKRNLGRPSTYVSHINKFLDRGLFAQSRLTPKGVDWLLRSEKALLTPGLSGEMEHVFTAGAATISLSDDPCDRLLTKVVSEIARRAVAPIKGILNFNFETASRHEALRELEFHTGQEKTMNRDRGLSFATVSLAALLCLTAPNLGWAQTATDAGAMQAPVLAPVVQPGCDQNLAARSVAYRQASLQYDYNGNHLAPPQSLGNLSCLNNLLNSSLSLIPQFPSLSSILNVLSANACSAINMALSQTVGKSMSGLNLTQNVTFGGMNFGNVGVTTGSASNPASVSAIGGRILNTSQDSSNSWAVISGQASSNAANSMFGR